MYALLNSTSGNYYVFQPAETGNGNVKVTYVPVRARHAGIVGHWKSAARAREQYRTLRRHGFAPAPVPAVMRP